MAIFFFRGQNIYNSVVEYLPSNVQSPGVNSSISIYTGTVDSAQHGDSHLLSKHWKAEAGGTPRTGASLNYSTA